MDTDQLLRDLEELNVDVELDGDRLRWRPPSGVMTPGRQEMLGSCRAGSVHPPRRRGMEAYLRQRLQQAADWIELSAQMDFVGYCYREGYLSREFVEELARDAEERSRQLPAIDDEW